MAQFLNIAEVQNHFADVAADAHESNAARVEEKFRAELETEMKQIGRWNDEMKNCSYDELLDLVVQDHDWEPDDF